MDTYSKIPILEIFEVFLHVTQDKPEHATFNSAVDHLESKYEHIDMENAVKFLKTLVGLHMVAIRFQIRGLDSLLQAHVCTSTQSLIPPHPVSCRHSQDTTSCHRLTPKGSISFLNIPEQEHVLQMCLIFCRPHHRNLQCHVFLSWQRGELFRCELWKQSCALGT